MKTIFKVLTILLLVGVLFGSFEPLSTSNEAPAEVTETTQGFFESFSIVDTVSADNGVCPDGSSGC